MSRNAESRFAVNPTSLDMPRSKFDRDSTVKTSFNIGELIPFYVDEVLPGDTFEVKTSKVLRMPALMTPIMDNIYLDTYFFYVPNRIVWDHWRELMGENTESAWYPTTEYAVPQLSYSSAEVGSLIDYFGLPVVGLGANKMSVSALPFRAYASICNEWFRNQNVEKPVYFRTDDSTLESTATKRRYDGVANTQLEYGGKPYKVYKYKDYFTACLPAPQKGPDVGIPFNGDMPVYVGAEHIINTLYDNPNRSLGLATYTVDGQPEYIRAGMYALDVMGPTASNKNKGRFLGYADPPDTRGMYNDINSVNDLGIYHPQNTDAASQSQGLGPVYPSNLWARNTGLEVTVNALRISYQVQKLFERDARGGTRYREILKSHFGVTSPDARMQIPEYLGGNRIPLSISQVLQQSGSTATSPQGTPTGFSLTNDSDFAFTKSFVEHGFVIGVMCARYDHTYQQGIERMWSRKSRLDYYWPVFANIGEQGVKMKEIWANNEVYQEDIFGYQEAWADYRYKPSRVTGYMRSGVAGSLDIWNLADYYSKRPSLSAEFLREDGTQIDRIFAVDSASDTHQIFADILIENRVTRCMPMYSVPGLVDHH